MPMKQGQRPKKHIVIRDLKRAPVRMEFKDRTLVASLINAMIPEKFLKDTNPNHPLEHDIVHCWNIERRQWDEFKISELENYQPEGSDPRVKTQQERTEDGSDPRETRNRKTGHEEGTQETQTDDRRTEGQGERESGEGEGRTWSSKE